MYREREGAGAGAGARAGAGAGAGAGAQGRLSAHLGSSHASCDQFVGDGVEDHEDDRAELGAHLAGLLELSVEHLATDRHGTSSLILHMTLCRDLSTRHLDGQNLK